MSTETKELKEYRERSGAQVEEIAREIGVTSRTVYNWIDGKVKHVHRLQLHRLRLFLKRKRSEAE